MLSRGAPARVAGRQAWASRSWRRRASAPTSSSSTLRPTQAPWAVTVARATATILALTACLVVSAPLRASAAAAGARRGRARRRDRDRLFGLASTRGLLAVVSVLASLYPVVTVALARIVLGERPRSRSASVGPVRSRAPRWSLPVDAQAQAGTVRPENPQRSAARAGTGRGEYETNRLRRDRPRTCARRHRSDCVVRRAEPGVVQRDRRGQRRLRRMAPTSLTGLPTSASPKIRWKLLYGLDSEDQAGLGTTYNYTYQSYDTSAAWENAFFAYLTSIAAAAHGVSGRLQRAERLAGRRAEPLDRRAVRRALPDRPPRRRRCCRRLDQADDRLHQPVRRGAPAIDHVYTKIGELDPDTGFDFGLNRDNRKPVAWGGTTPDDEETGYGGSNAHRVWFYDLSAGPEVWGGSFDVNPIWTATARGTTASRTSGSTRAACSRVQPSRVRVGHARRRSQAVAVRYVGLDLLITASPLYNPYFAEQAARHGAARRELGPGLEPGRRERLHQAGLFLQELKELPSGFNDGLTADYQDIKSEGDWNRCGSSSSRTRPATTT